MIEPGFIGALLAKKNALAAVHVPNVVKSLAASSTMTYGFIMLYNFITL
jgi:hypothetical protein